MINYQDRVVTFVVPFAPRQNVRDWDLCCLHLLQTVKSLLASKDPRLAVVVVAHEQPSGLLPADERVEFILCDHSPALEGDYTRLQLIVRDKMLKLQTGLGHARKHTPSKYIMAMDADDLLSNNVVGFLANTDTPGWIIKSGYIWSARNRFTIERTNSFDALCGSSIILRSDFADLPFDVEKHNGSFPEELLGALKGFRYSLFVNEIHVKTFQGLAEHGCLMREIPFPAAVYRIANLNSATGRDHKIHSMRFLLGRVRRLRLLSPRVREEFSINLDAKVVSGKTLSPQTSENSMLANTKLAPVRVLEERLVTFVLPLVARIDDEQWRDRCARLRQTLSSLLNSTNPDFEIVIAGHDKPDNLPYDKRVHFVPVDFERPPRDADMIRRRRDMLWKIRAAWDYARRNWSTRYVMRVDADDMLSNKLVQWLAENGELPGYRLIHGWITKDSWRRWLKKEDAFYLCCGSSVIVDARYTDFEIEMTPEQLGAEGITPDEIGNLAPAQKRTLLVSNKHGRCLLNFDRHGLKMGDIPFRAAVYRLGSAHSLSQDQHNISSLKMFVSSVMRSRPITASVNREFALGS